MCEESLKGVRGLIGQDEGQLSADVTLHGRRGDVGMDQVSHLIDVTLRGLDHHHVVANTWKWTRHTSQVVACGGLAHQTSPDPSFDVVNRRVWVGIPVTVVPLSKELNHNCSIKSWEGSACCHAPSG